MKYKQNNSKRSKNYLKHDQVSHEFRELFILTGYRIPNSSLKTCLKSIFCLNNNETINFWTHFIPFIISFFTLIKYSLNNDIKKDSIVWPLFMYLTTICFYLLMSSIAHALNCMSPIARHICFILDYLSISIYGMGCTIAYKAYSLSTIKLNKKEKFFDYYVFLALCFSLFANVLACSSRFVVSRHKRSLLRTISFVTQYIFVNLPLLYRFMFFYQPNILKKLGFMFSFLSSAETELFYHEMHLSFGLKNESDKFYIIQFIAAILSAILYIFHIPERIWPGKFDIIGQSHQIFHLTAFVCTWSQFTALGIDMEILRTEYKSKINEWNNLNLSTLPYFGFKLSYTYIMSYCLLLNTIILIYYYFKAVYFNPWVAHNQTNDSFKKKEKNGFKKHD